MDFDPFAGPRILGTFPSTETQREIWTAAQVSGEANLAYNESISVRLKGELDRPALEQALKALVQRHEALRATFSPDGLSVVINESVDVPLLDVDCTVRPDALTRLLEQVVKEPFHLERGPLARAHLAKLGAEEHVLVFTAHHIVCDGWSAAVVVREWGELYSALKEGREPSLPPAPAFSAWAREVEAHRATPAGKEEEQWWVQRFSGGELPVLELPTDRPRPPLKTYASLREDFVIDEALVARLKKAGAKERASLFAVLLAGFNALLHKLTGQDDLVVGIPSAGQSIGGYDALVGHCVNMLPLRTRLSPDAPVAKLVQDVRGTLLDGQGHQLFTMGQLLQRLPIPRDPSRLPLVSVIFNVDRGLTPDAMPFAGLTPSLDANPRRFETYDLFLNAVELQGRVKLECQYNTDLFDAGTMRRWLAAYQRLLGSMADALERGAGVLGDLSLLSEEEQRALEAWNQQSALDVDPALTVVDLLEAQAKKTPTAVAVECEGRRYTYAELDAKGNAIAQRLAELGVGRGKLVGLSIERGVDMVAGVVGVLKSGAGYVPLDPGYPTERLAFMVEDAGIDVLLTERAVAQELKLPAKHTVLVEDVAASAPAVAGTAQPEDVCYVIFTSGSTGKPKGVLLPHRAVVNLLKSVQRTPGLTGDDTVLAVTTLSFDIAVSEILLPLTVGARIVIATRDVTADGQRLLELLKSSQATFLDATPATYRLLLGAGWSGGDLHKCICTGEAMPRDLAVELTKRVPSVWNGYGPTETCVWSTFYEVKAPVGRILIGKPVANTQCHVLDARRKPVLPGVVGELFIGGRGVALGYLNRPELTKERFVEGMYKTGDLVRVLPDGNLECLGRNDFQVKLRGFRIELGEIEDALTQHPAIRQAACIVREVKPGDPRLLGYVVLHPGQEVTDADVRAHLKRTLPDYMVPQSLTRLTKMPLSPAGKIDRKALPEPDLTTRSDDFVPPRTPTEQWLCGVWQELLRVGRVGITDDFFALGGHSLLAAQLMARLGRERDVKLSLRRLFEAPTVQKLATLIDARAIDAGAAVVAIPRRADPRTAPQSLMQRRLWYLDQLADHDIGYNAPSAFRLHGPLDVSALERTLAEISRRHESLRTSLDEVNGEPIQRIDPSLRLQLERAELPGVPEGDRVKVIAPLLQAEADVAFDLTRAPLARAKLFTFAPDDNVVFFMPHHIIWDGWSFDLFLEELSVIYGAFAAGKPSPLPEPDVQYGDFAAWHNQWLQGPELERQAEYWVKALKPPLTPLDLPGDRPRPPRMSGEGGFESLSFDAQETEKVQKAARRLDATPYMILLAGFDAVLHRYTGATDLVIGTPVRGRTQPQIEKTLGFFVNTLVLRNEVQGSQRFDELVAAARQRVLEAFSFPDMPFELLVERLKLPRDPSRTPVYQAMFSFQEASARSGKVGDLRVSQLHVMAQGAMTDLVFWLLSKREGLVGGLSYNADLFDPPTARRFLQHFKQLVLEASEDPSRKISELKLVTDAEQASLRGWNEAVRTPLPQRQLLHHEVLRQVEATPDAVAVSHGDTKLTYRELAGRAHAVAAALHARGVRPGDRVGLCVERSADMVAAMLGILETGAAYVPLDPAYPEDRIAFMVEDGKLKEIVTERRVLDELTLPQGTPRLLLEEIEPSAPSAPDVGPLDPEHAAYVIYTSGSTGRPKGVRVPHRAVTNFLQSMRKQPGLGPEGVVLAVTTLSFDIAVLELWLPLTCGARVAVASREDSSEADRLIALMGHVKPTLLQATPVTWRMLLDGGWQGDAKLTALVGGEALPIDLARRLVDAVGALWNMYGPTETTVWSTLERVTAPVERVLIGRPIDNTSLYVLDAQLQPVPLGVVGELFIGGEGVTSGYLDRPELTAEKFLHDPFAGRPGARMYRTGDLARFTADGRVECLGRTDGQVKVRGHRIEVGEIEARLAAHPSVSEACVVARDDARGEKRLVAYVVPKTPEPIGALELRKHVRKDLPDYMVPNLFEELPKLPRTPNGKVDRKALPAPSGETASEAAAPPRTANERLVAEVWGQVLGGAKAGVTDNFFDLGGHSLLAFKAIAELERRAGKRVSARTLMIGTLEQVAAELPAASPQKGDAPSTAAPPKEPEKGLRDRVLGRLKGLVKR